MVFFPQGKGTLPAGTVKILFSLIYRDVYKRQEWENRLLLIERGQLDGKEFLEGVTELVKTVMERCV